MNESLLEWIGAQQKAAQEELDAGRRAIEEMERRCDTLYGAVQAFEAMREKALQLQSEESQVTIKVTSLSEPLSDPRTVAESIRDELLKCGRNNGGFGFT